MCESCWQTTDVPEDDDGNIVAPNWGHVATEINWKLLDASICYAIIYPERFDMNSWVKTFGDIPDAALNGTIPESAKPDNTWITQVEAKAVRTPSLCGTTACLAGTALHLSGYRPVVYREGRSDDWTLDAERMVAPGNTKVEHVPVAASRELGISVHVQKFLNQETLDTLFYGPNIRTVIDFRNALAVKVGAPERDFAEAYAAERVLDEIDAAQVVLRYDVDGNPVGADLPQTEHTVGYDEAADAELAEVDVDVDDDPNPDLTVH